MNPILTVKDLAVSLASNASAKPLPIVNKVSFTLHAGQTLGIVGESGCGKTMTALALLRLTGNPTQDVIEGSVELGDQDLLQLSDAEMQRIRGARISMIFQEPMTSLNPVFSIKDQMMAVLKTHTELSDRAAELRILDLLNQVGLPQPKVQLKNYPHQLSGGMKQRVMIAMALLCEPDVLIADEPTTALDVTIQAQILHLLMQLQQEYGMAMLFISHNLAVVQQVSHEVAVMYAGQFIEQGNAQQVLSHPAHPYTQGLIHAIPHFDSPQQTLYSIPGTIAPLYTHKQGCRFQNRCSKKQPICQKYDPQFSSVSKNHACRCFLLYATPASRIDFCNTISQ